MSEKRLVEISQSLFIDPHYKSAFSQLGLTSIDAVFSFDAGRNLGKNNLPAHRSRLQFEISPKPSALPVTLFLKRYNRPPVSVQLRNWLSSGRRTSCSFLDFSTASKLSAKGINAPKTIAYGEQWGKFFEKRSFIITEKIPNAESLERALPDYFDTQATTQNLKMRRDFIDRLAAFVRKFHEAKYRHRDLYLSHIFYDSTGRFYLIDLARAFRPFLLGERFRRKDIAQVYYSAPARHFSQTDRLRFYRSYTGRNKLTKKDKVFIRKVVDKARRMARHDIKHSRPVPFAT
jgi:hypothetical protein